MSRDRINKILNRIPTHAIIIFMILVWVVPTFGLLVTSLRPSQAINTSGWWTILSPPRGSAEYTEYCAACHGSGGDALPSANLSDPQLVGQFPRSLQLLAALRRDIDGQPHMGDVPLPEVQAAADIAGYLKQLSGIESQPRFTFSNYIDALVGYRGTTTYQQDCAAGTAPLDIKCDASDLLNPRGMGRAFVN
ncbi:MAG TPA: c-type cytochrome, partial [Anaerolineales bacterium]|nr:c-type cytochrome [Anaerolineales bacterium]